MSDRQLHHEQRAQHLAALGRLRATVQSFADGHMGASALRSQCDAESALFAALPVRFRQVWLGIADRLESSALFSGESCSFSQDGLVEPLWQWLDAAETQLA
jgi:hypothetical protein